jgi:aldehyde:ferredoxin oxidoreductase
MVLCRFSQFAMNPEHYARLLRAVTGVSFNDEELISIGERIYNLERVFNVREGFSRRHDMLPKRFLETPLLEGHSKNTTVALEPMLEEYYELRGWAANGIPTHNTLSELRLNEAAKQIADANAI